MSFQSEFVALVRAANQDLSRYNPYLMVRLVEFGKVGGYSDAFVDFREDILYILDLYSLIRPKTRFPGVTALEPPKPNRFIDEDALQGELDVFQECLAFVATAVDEVDESDFVAAWENMSADGRRDFADALQRAGVDAEAVGARRRENVYVSAGFPSRLLRQVVPAIRIAGLAPVLPQHAVRTSIRGADWEGVKARIAACAGGVINFVDPDDPAISKDAKEIELQMAIMAKEVAEANLIFPRRLLILAREDALEKQSELVKDAAIFFYKGAVMDAEERGRFTELIKQKNWM